MNWGIGAIAALVGGVGLVTVVLVSGLAVSTTRETTGIEEKYSQRTMAERDALFGNSILGLDFSDTATSYNNPDVPADSDDYDNDGISNASEIGGSYTKPGWLTDTTDSDGDGMADLIESKLGRDPSNANEGIDSDKDGIPDYVEDKHACLASDKLDSDDDGTSDAVELITDSDPCDPDDYPLLGTDPSNPDTDGDDVNDATEILLGTDPTDPNDGGPAIIDPSPENPLGNQALVFDNLVKEVRSTSSLDWTHYTRSLVGEIIDFRITVKIIGGSQSESVTIKDVMSENLSIANDGLIDIDGSTSSIPFDDTSNSFTYTVNVAAFAKKDLTLTFSAIPTDTGISTNSVRAYLTDSPMSGLGDAAFVSAYTSLPTAPIGGNLTVTNFNKQVKQAGDIQFSESANAAAGDTLNFKISFDTLNTYSTNREILITDLLPAQLSPISGSAYFDEIFRNGFATLSVPIGSHNFSITFSAKVENVAPATVFNTFKILESKLFSRGISDTARIVIE